MIIKKSLFFKMFLNLTIVLIMFGLIVALGTQIFLRNDQTNRIVDILDGTMKETELILQESDDKEETNRRVHQLAKISNTIIYIYKSNGNKDEIANTAGEGFDYSELTIIEHIKYIGNAEIASERSEIDGTNVYYMLAKKESGSNTIEIRQNMQNSQQILQSTTLVTRWLVLIAATLALTWAFLYSRWFTLPISEMNRVTKGIAKLDFSAKAEARSQDELGQLAGSINEMSDKLSSTMNELNEKNKKLEEELERERSLENMRKKFVSDVSHELKTPLSIIQGYAEALEMQANKHGDKYAKYSHAIMDETQRMTKLVHDLLNLSNYQSGNYVLKRKDCAIDELIINIAEKHRPLVESKGLTIETNVTPHVINIDPDRIEQVIVNLLNNAISHVDEKNRISINGSITIDGYRVSIYNSGSHIAENQIEKLWTPFYRADDSRKRDQGRYGIGLSIVKALLELHGASFGVQNLEGGVEFFFKIKNDYYQPMETKNNLSAGKPEKTENSNIGSPEVNDKGKDPFPDYKDIK